jgi:hypothetical protein
MVTNHFTDALLSKNRLHYIYVESVVATAKPRKKSRLVIFSGTKLKIDLCSNDDNDDKQNIKINYGEINDAKLNSGNAS